MYGREKGFIGKPRQKKDIGEKVSKLLEKLRSIENFSEIKPSSFVLPGTEFSAKDIAEAFGMKMHQLRKFFEKVKKLDSKYKSIYSKKGNENIPQEDIEELQFLVPHAYYAVSRKHAKESFSRFIEESVKKIHKVKDLEVFVKFFTCLVAYSKERD